MIHEKTELCTGTVGQARRAFGPGSGVGVQGRLPGEKQKTKKKLSMVLKDELEQGEGAAGLGGTGCSGRGGSEGIAWRYDIARQEAGPEIQKGTRLGGLRVY